MKTCTLLIALIVSIPTAMADVVSVFGLPLGGKLEQTPRQCPKDDKKQAHICWIDKPFYFKPRNSLSGSVRLPEAGLPTWALYQVAEVNIRNRNELESIKFGSDTLAESRNQIVDSISMRFGRPTVVASSGAYDATWTQKDLSIKLFCYPGRCNLEFIAAREVAERNADIAKAKSADAARPLTP